LRNFDIRRCFPECGQSFLSGGGRVLVVSPPGGDAGCLRRSNARLLGVPLLTPDDPGQCVYDRQGRSSRRIGASRCCRSIALARAGRSRVRPTADRCSDPVRPLGDLRRYMPGPPVILEFLEVLPECSMFSLLLVGTLVIWSEEGIDVTIPDWAQLAISSPDGNGGRGGFNANACGVPGLSGQTRQPPDTPADLACTM